MKQKKPNKKGLTDQQLIAKYDKGGRAAFKRDIKSMLANPNPNAYEKNKKD